MTQPHADLSARVKKAARAILAAWLLMSLAAGCQLPWQKDLPPPTTPTPVEEIAQLETEEAATQEAAAGVISVDSAPLRFSLPTPGAVPKSLWRPPLYDTPWALGPNDHFFFSRPIAADETNWPIADYRYGGTFFSTEIVHTGVDIPSPRNTPVLAAAGGKVIWAGFGLFYGNNSPEDPYGLAVSIRHDFGFEGQSLYTIYAHMDQVLVTTGQEVKTGEVLGLVGTTGFTTGPHLHFEVRTDRNSYFATLNPELWMAPPQGWGVLVGQLRNANGTMIHHQDVLVRSKDTGQKWVVRTYGDHAVNSDPYYQENLVLSDLPAGKYEITVEYEDEDYQQEIQIYPGAVSYFTFHGKLLFNTSLPPTPSIDDLLGETRR